MNQSKTLSSDRGNGGQKFCPLLNDPEPDCYCLNLTSLNIPLALKFCQGDYLACKIYLRLGKKEHL